MPRTRSLAWAQLRIGLLAVAGLVLAATFIFLVGGQSGLGWSQYHLKTRFTDVQGLKTGAVVRFAGVEVGTVDTIEFVGAEVEIVLKVNRDMQDKITSNSRASIGSLSLLGAPVIDVSAGPGGRALKDWEFIPSRRPYGQLADVADSATKGLQEATRLIEDLRQGKGTVGKLFSDDQLYREINEFVLSAEAVITKLNKGDGTLGRLLVNPTAAKSLESSLQQLSDITARINAGEGSIGRLLKDDAFAKSLSATTGNLEQISARINKGEGTAGKLVTDPALFNRLNSVSERLDRVMTQLNEGQGTAGQLLRDKQLYENMNAAVAEMRGLVSDIRKDPKKYLNVRVSIF